MEFSVGTTARQMANQINVQLARTPMRIKAPAHTKAAEPRVLPEHF